MIYNLYYLRGNALSFLFDDANIQHLFNYQRFYFFIFGYFFYFLGIFYLSDFCKRDG